MIYQTLHVMPLLRYFAEVRNNDDFDVVVAADVFAYVGELRPIFREVIYIYFLLLVYCNDHFIFELGN